MGEHDAYGKAVLKLAAGSAFTDWGDAVSVAYGARGRAAIDGVVGGSIAVEIESRTSKQVRGAVLDLICHGHLKKLLVLVPLYMSNVNLCAEQCRDILGRFLPQENFRVVVLTGTGFSPSLEADAAIVRDALAALGFGLAGYTGRG